MGYDSISICLEFSKTVHSSSPPIHMHTWKTWGLYLYLGVYKCCICKHPHGCIYPIILPPPMSMLVYSMYLLTPNWGNKTGRSERKKQTSIVITTILSDISNIYFSHGPYNNFVFNLFNFHISTKIYCNARQPSNQVQCRSHKAFFISHLLIAFDNYHKIWPKLTFMLMEEWMHI